MKAFNSIFRHFLGDEADQIHIISYSRDNDQYTAILKDNTRITFSTGMQLEYLRDVDKYEIALVTSKHSNQFQTAAIKEKSETSSTIGYAFPLNSLRDFNELPDGNWLRRFAVTGVHKLFYSEIDSAYLSSSKSICTGEQNFFDLFDDSSILIVLGKEQLENAGTCLEEILLLIHRYGYYPIKKYSEINCVDFEGNLPIYLLSPFTCSKMSILSPLINNSKHEQNSISRFITLYQIIELYIDRLFACLVLQISNGRQIEPRKLKERLSECSSEQHRINFLYSCCLKDYDHSYFAGCHDLINNFIKINALDSEDEACWSRSIYKLRCALVHSSFKLQNFSNKELSAICDLFEHCCFEIMLHYNEECFKS